MKLINLRDLVINAARDYATDKDSSRLMQKLEEVIEIYKKSEVMGSYYHNDDFVIASFYVMEESKPPESLSFTYSNKTRKFFYNYSSLTSSRSKVIVLPNEIKEGKEVKEARKRDRKITPLLNI